MSFFSDIGASVKSVVNKVGDVISDPKVQQYYAGVAKAGLNFLGQKVGMEGDTQTQGFIADISKMIGNVTQQQAPANSGTQTAPKADSPPLADRTKWQKFKDWFMGVQDSRVNPPVKKKWYSSGWFFVSAGVLIIIIIIMVVRYIRKKRRQHARRERQGKFSKKE